MATTTVQLNVRLTPMLYKRVQAAAELDRTTATAIVRDALSAYCDALETVAETTTTGGTTT